MRRPGSLAAACTKERLNQWLASYSDFQQFLQLHDIGDDLRIGRVKVDIPFEIRTGQDSFGWSSMCHLWN